MKFHCQLAKHGSKKCPARYRQDVSGLRPKVYSRSRLWFIGFVVAWVLGVSPVTMAQMAGAGSNEQYLWQPRQEFGAPELRGGELELRSAGRSSAALHLQTDFDIRVNGLIAEIIMKQTFRNPGKERLDGVYRFPLQESSAVKAMSIQIGDRKIVGRIKEKAEAKRIFKAAKAKGQRAGLTEQLRPNVFRQSLANIGPGETVVVELTVLQKIEVKNNHGSLDFELRLPTTITPRYQPSAQLQASPNTKQEDAISLGVDGWPSTFTKAQLIKQDRKTNDETETDAVSGNKAKTFLDNQWTLGQFKNFTVDEGDESSPETNTMSLAILLNAGLPLLGIHSESHRIKSENLGRQQSISLTAGHEAMDRDFVLRWQLDVGVKPTAAMFRETLGQEEYALLMLMPPLNVPVNIPRELIFIIDTSGSMGGESIRQAKAALSMAVGRLGLEDRFNIIEFNSNYSLYSPSSVGVNKLERRQALGFVENLEASGGTNMAPALNVALTADTPEGFVKQIVFITDGSVSNEAELFELVDSKLGEGRLFTVGIGSAPNGYFMSQAAKFGRGSHTSIGNLRELGAKMEILFRRLESPVLTDVNVEWPAELKVQMWPENIPDLYWGEPLTVSAKLTDNNSAKMLSGEVTVTGSIGGAMWQQRITLAQGTPAEHNGVASLWAREKISALLNQKIKGRAIADVRKDVLEVALRHQLMSPFTSFVAVEERVEKHYLKKGKSKNPQVKVANLIPKGSTIKVYPKTATGVDLLLLTSLFLLLLAYFVMRPWQFVKLFSRDRVSV